jgi:hypothetical protein
MQGRTRRATAIGAAAFALAGSAALTLPGTASAAVITGSCGATIQGTPGDQVQIDPSSLLGLPAHTLPVIDLGIVSQGTQTLTRSIPVVGPILGGILNKLCSVTVVGVNTVTAPVAAGASTANKALTDTAKTVGGALGVGGTPAPQQSPAGGSPQAPVGGSAGNAPGGQTPGSQTIPDSNSPVLGGGSLGFGSLPLDFSTGYAPMRDYSTIPMAMAGVYAPSPGLRYGGQIPGYAPEFGLPGDAGTKQDSSGVQNAGQAEALPSGNGVTAGVGLPVLIAVLSLSGVSAGLVRTWVLRRTAASA